MKKIICIRLDHMQKKKNDCNYLYLIGPYAKKKNENNYFYLIGPYAKK